MPEPYTLREISAAVARAENRPDEERIFQQLKGASARGLLNHDDTYGPKGALRFNLEEVANARMILRAVDSGMMSAVLANFVNDLRLETRKVLANGRHVTLSLAEAVQRISDDDWSLQIVVTRGIEGEKDAGELQHGVTWLPNGQRFDDADPLDPETIIPGKIVEEVRFIRFSALVKPIFAALSGG